MKEWKDLSMREKHAIMKQYVSDNIQNGIYKGGGVLDVEQYYNEYAEGGNLFSGEEEHPQNLNTPYITTPAIPLFNTPRNWSTWTPQGEAYYQEHYDPYLKQAYSIYDGRTNSYKQPPLPEVIVTASNPAYSNNAEMQRGDGESENDYIERMSQLNKDRYDFAQGVRDAQRQYAGITGAALGTVGAMGLGATVVPTLFNIMTNPVVETAFGIDALHRQLGPDGYKKTINLFNQGDWRAIPSLGVDLMDLTMLGAGSRGAYKTINGAYDAAKKGLNLINNKYGNIIFGPDGKIFNAQIQYNPQNYYRGVGRTAIEDANELGLIRGVNSSIKTGTTPRAGYGEAYFGKGKNPWDEGYVIEGTPESTKWASAGQRENYLNAKEILEEVNNGKNVAQQDVQWAKETINKGDFAPANGWESLPYTEGEFQAPVSNFTYYQKYPLFGWRQKQFKSNIPTSDINTARAMQEQSQILGKAPKKYYNGDIEGERFGELISDEGSEKMIYQDASNPNRILKVYDSPHDNIDKEFIPNPLVDEIHEGWVTTPDGKYYRVTSQPKYSNIPTSYTKEQENAIIKLLKDNGWEPYIDNESGRLELATKGEKIMNDLGPGNIAFSNNGVPMIIDNNIIDKKYGWDKGLTRVTDSNNTQSLQNATIFKSELDWSPESWFSTRKGMSGKPYSKDNILGWTKEEAQELASHINEYEEIEQQAKSNGTWLKNEDGSNWKGDPREWIMRQSENFKKTWENTNNYTGTPAQYVERFEKEPTQITTWSATNGPEFVEEYAISGGGGEAPKTQQKWQELITHRQQDIDRMESIIKEAEAQGKAQVVLKPNASSPVPVDIEVAKDRLALRKEALQRSIDQGRLKGGKVYNIVYPKGTTIKDYGDVQGSNWRTLDIQDEQQLLDYANYKLNKLGLAHDGYSELLKEKIKTFIKNKNYNRLREILSPSTDNLVNYDYHKTFKGNPGITRISNVRDTYNGMPINENIIHSGTPKKSVLGNTGELDLSNPSLYRSLFPLALGTGAYTLSSYALGGPLFNSSSPIESFMGRKTQLPAVRYDDGGVKKTTARKVNFPEFLQKKGTEARATNIAALEQLQDSLIARKYPEAQRAAILATSYNEMDSRGGASRGVGGNGMMGLSKDRMPITLLGDTPEMRGKQIHHILEDLGTVHTGTHPQAGNWSDGGTGGPKIMSGQDGYNQFNSTTDAYNAAMILNKSYVRPRDRVPAWQNRGNDARLMQKYMHDDGGILEKIRQRLYTNIDPTMDYAYSIPAAIKAINGIDTHGMYPDETNMSNITGNPQVNRELWARYLQQPMTPTITRNSQYKPVGTEQTQIAVNPNVEDTQNFVNEATALPKFNRYYGSTVLGGYGMNNHAIAKAVDGYKGQYVAYRDTYDLNPFHGDRGIANIPGLSGLGDLSFGVGKPVPMYDRIYLDDYYGVNSMPQKDEYYGGYIPEVTVTPKKSIGGKLRTIRRLSTQF